MIRPAQVDRVLGQAPFVAIGEGERLLWAAFDSAPADAACLGTVERIAAKQGAPHGDVARVIEALRTAKRTTPSAPAAAPAR